MFAAATLERAPLVGAIVNGLQRAADHPLRIGFFRDVLRRAFSEAETERQLEVALDWGRYAELYSYDADHNELALDPALVARETRGS
jgi:NitT/TauT family transport system ATP-binding protein